MKHKILLSFCFSLFSSLFFSAFFPPMNLLFFAPFLILVMSRYSLLTTLWLSLFSGLLMDLFSSCYFGFSALHYLFTTLCFYPHRKLFNERVLSLSLASFLFALFFSVVQVFLLWIFTKQSISFFPSLVSIFLLTPIMNLLYTNLFFTLLLPGLENGIKRMQDWHRKKNRSSDE